MLSKIFHALDNTQKIGIMKYMLENGETTVTDLRNNLNLSFSTAHKYLNQLEVAGLTTSKSEIQNGKTKRIYTPQDFNLTLTPETLLNNTTKKENTDEIEIVNKFGSKKQIRLTDLKNKLLSEGLSPAITTEIIYKLKSKSFKGMFTRELDEILLKIINQEIEKLDKLRKITFETQTARKSLFQKDKDLITTFEERGLNKALIAQQKGALYIRNPDYPYPINLQHNIRLLFQHGPRILGLDSNAPNRTETALSHIELAINAAKNQLSGTQQSIDYLNLYLAPYLANLNDKEIKQAAQSLMFKINDLCQIEKLQVSLGIEVTMPKHMKNKPAYVGGKEIGTLGDYEAEAIKLRDALLDLIIYENFKFPKLMLKYRKKKIDLPSHLEPAINNTYTINLNPEWQSPNAFYTVDWTRLGYEYKEQGSTATGEMQAVTLNLPRLSYKTNDEQSLTDLVDLATEIHLSTAEQILARQYTKLKNITTRIDGEKYVNLDQGIYQIRLNGAKDYLELTGKNQQDLLKMLSQINKTTRKSSLRIEVSDIDFHLLNQRFAELDKKYHKSKKEYYHSGLNLNLPIEENIKYQSKIQPLQKGGHCAEFKEIDINTLDQILKSNIGMAAPKSPIWLI